MCKILAILQDFSKTTPDLFGPISVLFALKLGQTERVEMCNGVS